MFLLDLLLYMGHPQIHWLWRRNAIFDAKCTRIAPTYTIEASLNQSKKCRSENHRSTAPNYGEDHQKAFKTLYKPSKIRASNIINQFIFFFSNPALCLLVKKTQQLNFSLSEMHWTERAVNHILQRIENDFSSCLSLDASFSNNNKSQEPGGCNWCKLEEVAFFIKN